jgi:putative transposase
MGLAFEHAYNEQRSHNGIHFVTPADRHRGVDPRRWSGNSRIWEITGQISFNPGAPQEIERSKLAV